MVVIPDRTAYTHIKHATAMPALLPVARQRLTIVKSTILRGTDNQLTKR